MLVELVQIKPWGNSQGIRLTKEILEQARVKVNDYMTVEVREGDIVLKKQFKHRTLEERIAASGGELERFGEYDWGEPEGREVW